MQRLLRRMRGTGPRATDTEARFFSLPCEGQALALRVPGRVFFVVRGPVSRDRFLILAILAILAILIQTRERLSPHGPFLLVVPMFYRH